MNSIGGVSDTGRKAGKMQKKITIKNFLFMNALFIIYSTAGVFLKSASFYDLFSAYFIFYFALAFIILVLYAIGWQQVLKRIPLSNAYLNKSIVIIWGIIWSVIIFHEKIDAGIIIGGFLILIGIFLVVKE